MGGFEPPPTPPPEYATGAYGSNNFDFEIISSLRTDRVGSSNP